jgi:hypothetical protein
VTEPRPPVRLLAATVITLAANVVVWRWPVSAAAVATRTSPAGKTPPAARLPPPQWTLAPGETSCAQVTADRARALSRLEGEVLRRRPYQEHYQSGQPSGAAKRWFANRLFPRLSSPPPGASIASDCRGEVCRIQLSPPPGDRSPYSLWLSEAVFPFDATREAGDREALVRYVRVPGDERSDGTEILNRFREGYPWDDLRGQCEREGPVPALGVLMAIRQHGVGDSFFDVSLVDRSGRTFAESTAGEACIAWTVLKALEQIDLPPSATGAAVRRFLEAPAAAQ